MLVKMIPSLMTQGTMSLKKKGGQNKQGRRRMVRWGKKERIEYKKIKKRTEVKYK